MHLFSNKMITYYLLPIK